MSSFIDLTALASLTSAQSQAETYGEDQRDRMGFFTDTTLCIGCKACEVACKEWNELPQDGYEFTGMSYDNTGELSGNTWRHVAFVEQFETAQAKPQASGSGRWLMESDVCKHCTHAGCLDVCPTGAIVRTEYGTVVIQEDVCNGCGYCVVACPFGVISEQPQHGTMGKCTLCYDRLKAGEEPACAKACPTDSIQFGAVDELRDRAQRRLESVQQRFDGAQLYSDGSERRHRRGRFDVAAARQTRSVRLAAQSDRSDAAPGANVESGRRGHADARRDGRALRSGAKMVEGYYGRPVIKPPEWTDLIPTYFFTGGMAGTAATLAFSQRLAKNDELARVMLLGAAGGAAVSGVCLIADLKRPERFLNMLRVFKPTSPMSVGVYIFSAFGASVFAATASELTGLLPRVGRIFEGAGALFGPAMSVYTSVLIADTVVPAWHFARLSMPALFAASSAASAGAFGMLCAPASRAGAARRLTMLGGIGVIIALERVHAELGARQKQAYETGQAAVLSKAARALNIAGTAAAIFSKNSAALSKIAGAMILAGGLAERFAVYRAGCVSAKDPGYTIDAQREGVTADASRV